MAKWNWGGEEDKPYGVFRGEVLGRIAASGDRPGGPTDPSPAVSAEGAHPLRDFDPSRWNELCCALANARYALEFWHRETNPAIFGRNSFMINACRDRGRQECATLWEMEKLVRYGSCDSGSDPKGENGRSPVECEASQSGAVKQAHRPENPAYFWLGIQAEGRE